MKTFAYCIRAFIITVIIFIFPILALLSFCLDWDINLKCLFTLFAVQSFIIVLLLVKWCMEDFSDG